MTAIKESLLVCLSGPDITCSVLNVSYSLAACLSSFTLSWFYTVTTHSLRVRRTEEGDPALASGRRRPGGGRLLRAAQFGRPGRGLDRAERALDRRRIEPDRGGPPGWIVQEGR